MEDNGCDIFSLKLPDCLRKSAKYHSPAEIRASPKQKSNVISLSQPAKNDVLVTIKASEDKIIHICAPCHMVPYLEYKPNLKRI
jgi:hypothetical protein